MPRHAAPRLDLETRLRNTNDAQGRVALAGQTRLAARRGLGNGGGQTLLLDSDSDPAASSAAQLLVMSATGDSIASGGDYVEFDTILSRHGFDGVIVAVGDAWMHPVTGVYVLTYDHEWDSYTGGGSVEMTLDAEVISGGQVIESASSGQVGGGTIAYHAAEGQVGRIKVTQSSGSAQTCDATAWISLPDPAAPISAVSAPASVSSTSTSRNSSGDMVHGAPTGTNLGDLMVVALTGYSLDGAQGNDGSISADADWNLEVANLDPDSSRQQFHVYTKVAGAADAAGSASYAWGLSTPAGTYGALTCFTIPQINGTTLSSPESETKRQALSFSVTPPAGDWLLACFLKKEHRSDTDNTGAPNVTNVDANELVRYAPDPLRGEHAIYALPADASPVTGTLDSSDRPSASLIVFGVSI